MHVWSLHIQQGTWYRADSPEDWSSNCSRFTGDTILNRHKMYQFVNGEMMPNPEASAPVGISKKKEVFTYERRCLYDKKRETICRWVWSWRF